MSTVGTILGESAGNVRDVTLCGQCPSVEDSLEIDVGHDAAEIEEQRLHAPEIAQCCLTTARHAHADILARCSESRLASHGGGDGPVVGWNGPRSLIAPKTLNCARRVRTGPATRARHNLNDRASRQLVAAERSAASEAAVGDTHQIPQRKRE